MFILPYFVENRISSSGYRMNAIYLFLEKGGTQLLSLDNSTPQEFCDENGLFVNKIWKKGKIYYVCVSREKTNMKSFYSFHDKNTEGLEVWRTFLWITDEEKKDNWTVNQKLKDISISNHSVYNLLETILNERTV